MEKLKGKIPYLRFPEFINAWEHKKLNELLIEAKKRNEDLKYGKDEVLSVSGELGIVNQIMHLGRSYAGVSVKPYHIVEVGDIVYTKSPLKANPYGIIKLNKGKAGIVSTLYAVYKVNPKSICGLFIDYYFSLDANTNRYLRPLVKKGAKNDMKISNTYVLHDRIFVPSLPEQSKIANFFTAVDNKLTLLKKKKSLLVLFKVGIMQKLFSQELRFKNGNGNDFAEWEEKKLGELFVFNTTNSFSRDNLNYEEGSVKNIHYGDIHTKFQTHFDITKELVPFLNGKISLQKFTVDNYCKEGDLIIADASEDYVDIGKAIEIVNLNNEKVIAGLHTLHARPNLEKLAIGYSGHFMKSESVRLQIKTQAQGTKVLSITTGRLSNVTFNLPCIDEQKKITSFLSAIDDKINQCNVQIMKMEGWKNGLLQKMFV